MSREEYNRDRFSAAVDAIVAEEFGKLFDPNFQVVFGLIPPKRYFRQRFDTETQWRVWKYKIVKLYQQWVSQQTYPDFQKILISEQIYNVLEEWPQPGQLKRRKKHKKRSRASVDAQM